MREREREELDESSAAADRVSEKKQAPSSVHCHSRCEDEGVLSEISHQFERQDDDVRSLLRFMVARRPVNCGRVACLLCLKPWQPLANR